MSMYSPKDELNDTAINFRDIELVRVDFCELPQPI